MAKKAFIIVLLYTLFLGSAVHALDIGDTAPDFSLKTLEGDTFTLSDYQGSIRVLFTFGCTWPLGMEIGDTVEKVLHQIYKDSGVVFLGIEAWNSLERLVVDYRDMYTEVTFPIAAMGEEVADAYSIYENHIIIIDTSGIVQSIIYIQTYTYITGCIREAKEDIESLLKYGITAIAKPEAERPDYKQPQSPTPSIRTMKHYDLRGRRIRGIQAPQIRVSTMRSFSDKMLLLKKK